jgi:arsenite methyltransferase
MATDLKEEIREHYAEAARSAGSCCGDDCCGSFYSAAERDALPEGAVVASLGCGNPTAVAELREGETVLDLGSGGGIDVLLSAKRVGPSGTAYGLDMTDEMLELARRNASEAGVANARFLKGEMEAIPLGDDSVDVVISNCVVNLSPDKPRVLREAFRVLRPGGRVGISDIVAEDRLTPEERAERGSYVGCIAGALAKGEYERELAEAGFADVSVELTHEVADGIHSALVKATKPPGG